MAIGSGSASALGAIRADKTLFALNHVPLAAFFTAERANGTILSMENILGRFNVRLCRGKDLFLRCRENIFNALLPAQAIWCTEKQQPDCSAIISVKEVKGALASFHNLQAAIADSRAENMLYSVKIAGAGLGDAVKPLIFLFYAQPLIGDGGGTYSYGKPRAVMSVQLASLSVKLVYHVLPSDFQYIHATFV